MNKPNHVWIVDDDKSIRWVLEKALNQAGISTRCFDNGDSAAFDCVHNEAMAIVAVAGDRHKERPGFHSAAVRRHVANGRIAACRIVLSLDVKKRPKLP